jgi:hypothetical protein
MPSSNPDDMLLLIRCPSCGQRFKVGEDLRGRTVECGGCEHRFRINDEVIVRGKKFYPGERKDPRLNRFHRVPLSAASAMPAGVAAVEYAQPPSPANLEPTSPLRILAGIAGVAFMAFMALLLMFGASRGGALDGMPTVNRLMMAGFTGLIGVSLLVFANPRARAKALAFGLLMTAGLLSLPFFFTVGSVPLRSGERLVIEEPERMPTAEEDLNNDEAELRELIGTEPLEEEIERLRAAGGTRQAIGLWIRNLREENRILVRDYILRTTGADLQSHYYPRGGGDFLMVVTGIDETLDEMVVIAAPLGKVTRVYPRLQVVEVRVNNEGFVSASLDKLTDQNHPAFYDLNKRALDSIDLEQVASAVRRLADAEPKIYRSDITRRLIALLGEDWVDFKADICNALAVWASRFAPSRDDPGGEFRPREAGGTMAGARFQWRVPGWNSGSGWFCIWRTQMKRRNSTFTAAVSGTASSAPMKPPSTSDQNSIEKMTVSGCSPTESPDDLGRGDQRVDLLHDHEDGRRRWRHKPRAHAEGRSSPWACR